MEEVFKCWARSGLGGDFCGPVSQCERSTNYQNPGDQFLGGGSVQATGGGSSQQQQGGDQQKQQ